MDKPQHYNIVYLPPIHDEQLLRQGCRILNELIDMVAEDEIKTKNETGGDDAA